MVATNPSNLHLYSLPNEVFVQILSPFSTRALLPLTAVSRRFHALILRILHYRVLAAAALKEYKLILECFHPTSKLTEPHVFCQYLGTPGLSAHHDDKGSLYEIVDTAEQLGRLGSLYSRFRPEVTVEERVSGTRLVTIEDNEDKNHWNDLVVTRPVSLEESEDFEQLCVVVNVVKVMPGSDLLLSAVTVVDGVIRLFRDWLNDQKRNLRDDSGNTSNGQMLWVDQGKNVGLKLRVREKEAGNEYLPVLVHRDDKPSVSYEVDIEELHIRTTRLLMTIERSLQEEQAHPRAVVFTQSLG